MKKPNFTDMDRYPRPYTPSGATDVAETFKRRRKQLAEEAERARIAEQERQVKVRKLDGRKEVR